MSAPTLFDRIAAGEIPSHIVHEDDMVFAFLDIAPQSSGHVLVVPRESRKTLGELSDASAAAIGRVLPRICRAVAAATGTPHCNILQNNGAPAGQSVPHVHFHVIPHPGPRGVSGGGLSLRWNPGSLDQGEGERMAASIREALGSEGAA